MIFRFLTWLFADEKPRRGKSSSSDVGYWIVLLVLLGALRQCNG